MKPITVKKDWGSEEWLENELYCVKRMTLTQGCICSRHRHPSKTETFYVISGKMLVVTLPDGDGNDLTNTLLTPGGHITIPAGIWHEFVGLAPTTFLECSTFHSDDDVERLTQSRALTESELKRYRDTADACSEPA